MNIRRIGAKSQRPRQVPRWRPGKNKHQIKRLLVVLQVWLAGHEMGGGLADAAALAFWNGRFGFFGRAAMFDLNEGHPLSAQGNEVDFTDWRFIASRNDAIALQPQEDGRNPFGKVAAAMATPPRFGL